MNDRVPGKAGCRSPTATTRRLTCAGTCTHRQPRPSSAPRTWLHDDSIPYSCLPIPVFPTTSRLTTTWLTIFYLAPAWRKGSVSYRKPRAARYSALPLNPIPGGGAAIPGPSGWLIGQPRRLRRAQADGLLAGYSPEVASRWRLPHHMPGQRSGSAEGPSSPIWPTIAAAGSDFRPLASCWRQNPMSVRAAGPAAVGDSVSGGGEGWQVECGRWLRPMGWWCAEAGR